ncbi:MAG: YCF48-related protein [Ignavibacteria bacterium]|nr:YCF48-related protein [Ignavibacteria bacterium]
MTRMLLLLSTFFLTRTLLLAQWTQEPAPTTGTMWAVRFVSESVGWLQGDDHFQSSDSSYIFKTTDGGASWTVSDTWLGSSYGALSTLDGMTILSSRSVTGIDGSELHRTTNGGITWENVASIADGYYEDIQLVDSQTGYSIGGIYNGSGYDGHVQKSTDGGATWMEVSVLPGSDLTGVSFIDPMNGWVSAYWNKVFRTTDGGITWVQDTVYAPPNTPTRDVQFTTADSGWTVGGISGDLTISRTTNGGVSWHYYESTACGSSLREIQMVNSQVGWVVGSNNCEPYVARTTDGGVTWETQETSYNGFESISVVNGNYGWACGERGNLWHTSNGGVTWVSEEVTTPNASRLEQNYPNPFNGISNIEFRISKSGPARLAIYDLIGREIAMLVDEELSPGTYQRQWDATDQASGVYYYRLQAGGFFETRKLVLIR